MYYCQLYKNKSTEIILIYNTNSYNNNKLALFVHEIYHFYIKIITDYEQIWSLHYFVSINYINNYVIELKILSLRGLRKYNNSVPMWSRATVKLKKNINLMR